MTWRPLPELLDDERFAPYGKLAPKSYEDLMFVEHMIYHMAEGDSRIAVLLPHGVLFRGGAEETIRTHMIKNQNLLDAVIGLPAGMFTTTGIAVACLIFKKQRGENENNICFIDASREYGTEGKINILRQEDMDKIVNAYSERKDIDKYCHIASMEEIEANRYNLNISRYVDTFEEEEPVDLVAVANEIKAVEAEIKELNKSLGKYFDELGLKGMI